MAFAHRTRSSRPIGQSRLARGAAAGSIATALALAAAAGVLAPAAPAVAQSAQVQTVEPFIVAAKSDGVQLKAGASSQVYYAVAMLKAGQTLRADGRVEMSGSWLRVEYPKGSTAFVRADSASLGDGGKSITLTKPTGLMAVNLTGGEAAHWCHLFSEERPTGAKFNVQETLKTPDGRVYGYLIPIPPEARAFVREDATRRATPEEIAAFTASAGTPAGGGSGGGTPALVNAPATNTPAHSTPATTPTSTPAATTPAGDTNPSINQPQPADPFTAPAGGGVQPNTGTPAAPPAGHAPAAAQPTAPQPAPGNAAPANPAERRTGTIEALQSLYEQAQTGKDVELPQVIAEFERKIQTLSAQKDEGRTVEALRARLEVLKLRQAVQESLAEAGRSSQAVLDQERKVKEQVLTLEKARNYAMVGRLVPSSVYDGNRLPKMFRIQSLEPGYARTIGYVTPAPDLDVKLGRVVGVVGEARFDDSLRLNIVNPKRVDLLSPTDLPGVNQDEPAKAPSTAEAGTDVGHD